MIDLIDKSRVWSFRSRIMGNLKRIGSSSIKPLATQNMKLSIRTLKLTDKVIDIKSKQSIRG